MDQRIIDQAHTIDDLCKEVARLRRGIRTARNLLSDVPHAIDNDNDNVALEYVDRARFALQAAVSTERSNA